MRNKSRLLFAVLPLVVPIVAGCGGSDDKDTTTPIGNGTVETGTASLNRAIAGSGDLKTELGTATTAFDQAYRRNNSDSRAALGYAIASSSQSAQTILDLFGLNVTRARENAKETGLVRSLRRLAPLASLQTRLGTKEAPALDTLLPFFATATPTRAYPTNPTPAQLRAALISISSSLATASSRLSDTNLNTLETTPLVLQYTEDGTTTSAKIGAVEGYALRSAIKVIRGFTEAALAYDFDAGTYDPSAAFEARFRTQLRAGTVIAASSYLPSGNFGTLTTGGGARLQAFGAQWGQAADDGKTAIARFNARTGTGWLTSLADAPSATDLTNAETYLTTFKSYLTSQQIVPLKDEEGNAINLTLNLPAWLDGTPPASLRAYFPSLQPRHDSEDESTTLTPVAGSISDPTYGGLIANSGGVPAVVLYGRTYVVGDSSEVGQGEVALWALAFPAQSTYSY